MTYILAKNWDPLFGGLDVYGIYSFKFTPPLPQNWKKIEKVKMVRCLKLYSKYFWKFLNISETFIWEKIKGEEKKNSR